MSIHNAESGKLYDLVGRHVGALPEGTQTSTRAQLDSLRTITTRTDATFERVEKTAQAREAARPIADAALKRAMQTKILGLTPTAAIVGTIAVGSIAIAATKLLRSGENLQRKGNGRAGFCKNEPIWSAITLSAGCYDLQGPFGWRHSLLMTSYARLGLRRSSRESLAVHRRRRAGLTGVITQQMTPLVMR